MASIRKRGNSYLLVVSMGYDPEGHRRKPQQKTVHPPEGLTPKAKEKWLEEEAALAAITSTAAEIAGISKRVGSLTPGKDADVVVTTGHPFDWNGRIKAVFIDGKQVAKEC